ncbi:hypothetical protein [Calidithermus timidus]|jgi:hypothetical protein|uniref:hypothetical protein n=1 Tax=Calidithermus timidus TaxID=307124 RepID=UPI0003788AC5|nr:hypothetical protein [Calidithermus timidus]
MRRWVPTVLLGLLGFGLAQVVQTANFFAITASQSRAVATPGAWRYTVGPRTAEARAFWAGAVAQWQAILRRGGRVELGAYALRLEGGQLRLEPHCATPNPACFTRVAVSSPLPTWQQDALLLDFSNALVQALAEAGKRAGPYPATVTVSKLVRVQLNPDGTRSAQPSGWKLPN